MNEREQASARTGRRRITARGAVLVALHWLLISLALAQLWGSRLNPPSAQAGAGCPNVRLDDQDDLVHLSLRPTEGAATAQLERWDACGPGLRAEARAAVERDRLLILTLAAALALAFVRTTSGTVYRWRLAGWCTGVLALLYVASDVIENRLLLQLLDGNRWSPWLPWAASVKFGALAGAAWIVVVSLADATGRCLFVDEDAADIRRKAQAPEAGDEPGGAGPPPPTAPPRPAARTPMESVRQFRMRRKAHALDAVFAGAEVRPPGTQMGISCSGGGIRSAAFNLGALQALDTLRRPDAQSPTELERASWLSCVSGGSYMAAAWVTARAPTGPGGEPAVAADAWARLSPDEDHLRRHASYMAPGLGGKLWAFWRFLFGFVVNMLAVILVLGTVFLPAGWLIDRAEVPVPSKAGGRLELPAGGCVRSGDGSVVRVPPGTALTVFGGRRIRLDPTAAIGAGGPARSGGSGLECVAGRLPDEGAWDEVASTPVRAGTTLRVLVDERLVVRATRIGAGSRLLAAPEVLFTPRRDGGAAGEAPVVAIVAPDGVLAEPCGDHPCEAFRPPAALRWGALGVGATTLLLGICLVVARASSEGTARRTERWTRWFSVTTLLVLALGFGFPELVVRAENGRWWLESQAIKVGGGFAAVASLLAGLVAQVAPFLRSGRSDQPGVFRRVAGAIRPLLVKFVGGFVGPAVIVAIAVAFASYAAQQAGIGWLPEQLGVWLAIVGPTAVLLAGGDLNEWSLHPYYRDRLRSAFAVDPRSNPPTDPREDAFWEPGTADARPRLLVCAAANLADDRVTAPGRPVASWVFRHDAIGCHALAKIPSIRDERVPSPGTIPTSHPSLRRPPLNHLAWTWTAVAVSGAAFSPAMGKMSRPERFLFALGNLRLGVWYPNPRSFAADPGWYERHHPRPWYLAKEALGLHKADDQWIYVTDGGHYENLGLVELLRLGCREIYCFDASGDSVHTFGTIAEAMRLAREEMGIEVTFDPSPLRPDDKGISKLGVWAGTIRFGGEEEPGGWLVVAKLQVPEQAPFDIVDLARSLPSFPTHPTADQLYTDQKFEAYRALGEHLGVQAAELALDIRYFAEHDGLSVARAVAAATAARCPRTAAASPADGSPPG